MSSGYFLNASEFPIQKFKHIIQNKDLLPARLALRVNIDNYFDRLISNGIVSLGDLSETLKSKSRLIKFANKTGFDLDYLTLLRREANSYLPLPVKLSEFSVMDLKTAFQLDLMCIINSKQFFEKAHNKSERQILAEEYRLNYEGLTELVKLCDLVRITGVGPVFAKLILDSGFHSVGEFISTDAAIIIEKLLETNKVKQYTRVKFTQNDIDYCIEYGKLLPILLEI
jgi:Domain of unknown function (DUF4332)